ncbi:MAG: cytochrome c biogenesis protein CcsA [Chloroflexi bacterium]|nr:cytochrome c biogenesis protein CcsA [Chloroflexota bacterium]MBI2982739.1 cytochrome c biogenesis protein CcsA [Chloroflexota bacterium]
MTTTALRGSSASWIRLSLGLASLAGALVASVMALVWAPPDANQGEVQRIMYVHVPSAWTAYLAFAIVFVASAGWLWTRRRIFDAIAVASAEIGVLFTGLALVAGSIWAKPTWGVWWTWEPRLITTAVMFVMYVGYLLLRSLSADVEGRATRAAVIGVVAVVNIPIVHLSVTWMNALHQLPTVLRPDGPAMDGRMLATLIVSVLAFTLICAWLMVARVALETSRQERVLDARGA